MYKSIVAGAFVWLSTTVLWFKRQPIKVNRQGRFFVALPVKRKPAHLLSLLEANSIGNWLNFAQMRQQKYHIF